MIKIVTLIGARPQIIKAAALSREISNNFKFEIKEVIVHTGQHYDKNMSEVFFTEMNIPKEKYNLASGSGSHVEQTTKIMIEFEKILIIEKPQAILLYGDTNSTLAGALVASKMGIKIIHVEGGVRMYDKDFPEEINRVLTDHLSTLIFAPSKDALKCLKKEGFKNEKILPNINHPKYIFSGDIMLDNTLYFKKKIKLEDNTYNLNGKAFGLITMHRHNLSTEKHLLLNVFNALEEIIKNSDFYFVFPVHPRLKNEIEKIKKSKLLKERLILTEPLSFGKMLELEMQCKIILTDSGGVQKEAYYLKKPCLILLSGTPWIELLESKSTAVCNYETSKILKYFYTFTKNESKLKYPPIYGKGNSARIICQKIIQYIK